MSKEKDSLEAQAKTLNQNIEQLKTQKADQEKQHEEKCATLENKLDEAVKEKDKLVKSQMVKIEENLENLKEQIASTNQSLMDQSYLMPPAESSQLAAGVIGRL